jgi:hypothetical protein
MTTPNEYGFAMKVLISSISSDYARRSVVMSGAERLESKRKRWSLKNVTRLA